MSWILSFLPRNTLTYVVVAAVVVVVCGALLGLHERAVSRALKGAREAGQLIERIAWQEAQRVAQVARDKERAEAERRIGMLAAEAAAMRGTIEAQENELERVIQEAESENPNPRPPLLGRSLVRELNRQGRTR